MTFIQIFILALIQGICELLPVSSSAHVIFAEKLMGLDPTTPEMTLLLVMLHTGTMFAVIVFFWKSWKSRYFGSRTMFMKFTKEVMVATLATGVIGVMLQQFIERVILSGSAHAEVESIFGNAYLIAASLGVVGLIIILSARFPVTATASGGTVGFRAATVIGAVQGLCLPFRGFSRSGSTISTGLFFGLNKEQVEGFSFALAVVITPVIVIKEVHRVIKAHAENITAGSDLMHFAWPGLAGMAFSFLAGLMALRWLSNWLEHGRWHFFGYYCLFAATVVLLANSFLF